MLYSSLELKVATRVVAPPRQGRSCISASTVSPAWIFLLVEQKESEIEAILGREAKTKKYLKRFFNGSVTPGDSMANTHAVRSSDNGLVKRMETRHTRFTRGLAGLARTSYRDIL